MTATTTATRRLRTTARPAPSAARPRRLWRDLDHPGQALAHITPNWFAAVMGTGIVGVAAASLPWQPAGLRTAAVGVWVLAAVLLVVVTGATVAHAVTHPDVARSHLTHPVMGHFVGAPPMAALTVGAGTLLLGRDVLGLHTAVVVDAVLWTVGTVAGLATAVAVPYRQMTRSDRGAAVAFGGWLMPVVPPMVSASTGALLVPHVAAGQARLTMLIACYAMFGAALLASLVVITLIWQRLVGHGAGDAATVPTLWIVLGPLGQSVTAAGLLGGVAHEALPAPYAGALQAFGVVYGVPVWGFALLWAALAAGVTLRTARAHLPFSLTWWSFTFPVGTVVTGTSGLALHTGADLFRVAAVVFYAGLVGAWALVFVRTAHGVGRGRLLLPPVTAAPAQ